MTISVVWKKNPNVKRNIDTGGLGYEVSEGKGGSTVTRLDPTGLYSDEESGCFLPMSC